jgi:hypothetical protein
MSTMCPYKLIECKNKCSHNVAVGADVGVRRLDQYGEVRVSEGIMLCACKLMHIDWADVFRITDIKLHLHCNEIVLFMFNDRHI